MQIKLYWAVFLGNKPYIAITETRDALGRRIRIKQPLVYIRRRHALEIAVWLSRKMKHHYSVSAVFIKEI